MMARLRVVRHATADQSCETDTDPGLSLAGIHEAVGLASRIGNDTPTRLAVSPCRRACETALPLAAYFGLVRVIVDAYTELPWRDGQTAVERTDDVQRFLSGQWTNASDPLRRWREALLAAATERGDVVIVSHFVAINVLAGAAMSDDRILAFQPANASVTEFAVEDGRLRLVSLGNEA
jgi:broad specificity phosphatase PhoE